MGPVPFPADKVPSVKVVRLSVLAIQEQCSERGRISEVESGTGRDGTVRRNSKKPPIKALKRKASRLLKENIYNLF